MKWIRAFVIETDSPARGNGIIIGEFGHYGLAGTGNL